MIADLLRYAAARAPDAVAFVQGPQRLTYAEWDWLSDRAARALLDEGVNAGDVVALVLDPSVAYPVCYLGVVKAGCIAVGVNTRLARPEIDVILEDCGARALITDVLEERAPRAFTPKDLIKPAGAPPMLNAKPDDPVAIVYTSGTTGVPRGAVYTNSALDAITRIEAEMDGSMNPVTLQAIPMAHMGFMTKIGSFISRMSTAVLMPRWSARAALEMIQAHHITTFGGVPTQLALMLREPDFDSFDLSSLRSVVLGGAPASPELVGEIRKRFNVPVLVRYSTTETALCCGSRPDDPDDIVARTVGRPLPAVDVVIDDPDGDGIGVVLARSPAMMAGYRTGDRGIDEHGFVHTGDLGRLRDDGNLELVGRAKDMYIRGGYNVYPIEVENALKQHAAVTDAAVIGIPDEILGERGLAFVVTSQPVKEQDLRDHLATQIASYKLPDLIQMRESLPLNSMYKVDKKALKDSLDGVDSNTDG